MTISINLHLLRADIRGISAEIRGLKRVLRSRWLRPMATEQRQLCQLQQRATELCALSAWSRGKLHLTRPPRSASNDWNPVTFNLRLVERLAPSYSSALPESA